MIEHVLELGSTDLPQCKCGAEMSLAGIEKKSNDTELKIFVCQQCEHELRLMVWTEETVDAAS